VNGLSLSTLPLSVCTQVSACRQWPTILSGYRSRPHKITIWCIKVVLYCKQKQYLIYSFTSKLQQKAMADGQTSLFRGVTSGLYRRCIAHILRQGALFSFKSSNFPETSVCQHILASKFASICNWKLKQLKQISFC